MNRRIVGFVYASFFLILIGIFLSGCATPALHKAILKGDYNAAEKAVKDGAKINELQKPSGDNAVHLTARSNHGDIMSLLLGNGGKVNMLNREAYTPLLLASTYSSPDMVKLLLDSNADITLLTPKGWSILHIAAARPNAPIVKIALAHKSDVDAQTKKRETALLLCIKRDAKDIFPLLIQAGADPNIVDTEGLSPLLAAMQNQAWPMGKNLLEAKADPNHQLTASGIAPAHIVCIEGNLDFLKFLKSYNANLSTRDIADRTPLHYAYNKPSLIRYLAKQKVDLNAIENQGNTALILASVTPLLNSMKTLLSEGADPNIRNTQNQDALHLVTAASNPKGVKLLFHYHADFIRGPLYMDHMLNVKKYDLALAFCKAGISPEAAIRKRNKSLLIHAQKVIKKNQFFCNQYKNKQINLRTLFYEIEYLKALLRQPEELWKRLGHTVREKHDAEKIESFIHSPALHRMVNLGNLKKTRYYLSRNISANQKNYRGVTPIFIASYRNDVAMAELVKKYGGDVKMICDNGSSPLHWAANTNAVEMVRWLISQGVNCELKTVGGQTASQVAQAYMATEARVILKSQNSGVPLKVK